MKKEKAYAFLRQEIPWGVAPFPILNVLREYAAKTFGADLKAGLNVALLAFPLGWAYALIAG